MSLMCRQDSLVDQKWFRKRVPSQDQIKKNDQSWYSGHELFHSPSVKHMETNISDVTMDTNCFWDKRLDETSSFSSPRISLNWEEASKSDTIWTEAAITQNLPEQHRLPVIHQADPVWVALPTRSTHRSRIIVDSKWVAWLSWWSSCQEWRRPRYRQKTCPSLPNEDRTRFTSRFRRASTRDKIFADFHNHKSAQ